MVKKRELTDAELDEVLHIGPNRGGVTRDTKDFLESVKVGEMFKFMNMTFKRVA